MKLSLLEQERKTAKAAKEHIESKYIVAEKNSFQFNLNNTILFIWKGENDKWYLKKKLFMQKARITEVSEQQVNEILMFFDLLSENIENTTIELKGENE
jgi:hypothetical protein